MENSILSMDHQTARVIRPFAQRGRGHVTHWVAEIPAGELADSGVDLAASPSAATLVGHKARVRVCQPPI